MLVQVESRCRSGGSCEPLVLAMAGRNVELMRIIDRWPGSDHSYFKVEASDGARYILRHATREDIWEMRWFQAPGPAPVEGSGAL
jgi:hypothetical protein